MLHLKTKNSEYVDLINGLFSVQDLQGVRFGLAVSKNIRILQKELKDLEDSSIASTEFMILAEKVKGCKDDEKALAVLEEENATLIEERKSQLLEVDVMMKDEAEITLHPISIAVLPEQITASQITNIDRLLID